MVSILLQSLLNNAFVECRQMSQAGTQTTLLFGRGTGVSQAHRIAPFRTGFPNVSHWQVAQEECRICEICETL